MAVKRNGTAAKYLILHNGVKLKKGYHNGTKEIWSAGSTVTYIVDTDKSYTEEVDYGATCLAPTTFTPSKSGWTFIGWREDTTATSGVLSSKTMESDPITLYAVYSQAVNCTFVSRNSSQTASGTRYYNASDNSTTATITVPTGSAYDGYTWRGWAAKGVTDADAAVTYTNGATISGLTSGGMYYGLYQKTITLTVVVGSNTTPYTGLAYHNSAGFNKNPKFTVADPIESGYTFFGWCETADGEVVYETISDLTLSYDKTLYASLKHVHMTSCYRTYEKSFIYHKSNTPGYCPGCGAFYEVHDYECSECHNSTGWARTSNCTCGQTPSANNTSEHTHTVTEKICGFD